MRTQFKPLPKPSVTERLLILYARYFPISRGKLRIVDAALSLVISDGDHQRVATLVPGRFKVPCDLSEMLQRQLYFFGTYYLERELLRSWGALAHSAEVVFDVGANAGIYSLTALSVNTAAQVHAFEPTPEIAGRLRQTAAMNKLDTLRVHEMAVTAFPGEGTLVRCRGDNDANDGMNYIRTDQNGGTERVETTSLDSFCANHSIEQIDLLKLDIQGGEAAALHGAARLLHERRIRTIFIELNWADPKEICPASESVSILHSNGFLFSKPGKVLSWRARGDWMRSCSDIIAQLPAQITSAASA